MFGLGGVLLSACSTLPDYERLDQPYDRLAICKRIENLLEEHHQSNNLSAASLKKLFDDYKMYGCDK